MVLLHLMVEIVQPIHQPFTDSTRVPFDCLYVYPDFLQLICLATQYLDCKKLLRCQQRMVAQFWHMVSILKAVPHRANISVCILSYNSDLP